MSVNDDASGTSDALTVESVAPVFEGILSGLPEYQDTDETPPTQQSPESGSESEEVEASTEQAESEEEQSEETEESEEEQNEQPQTFRTKVNGEEVEVTLDELLKGYSRTSDYTRKTQELAAQRKAVEEHIPAVRAERERLAAQLTQLEQALVEVTPAEPDWARLQQESPEEFPAEWARWSQHKERMAALRQQREQAQQAVLQDREQSDQELVKVEREKLLEAIPEWAKDPAKAKAEKAKMVAFAEELGYTKEQLAAIRDHRALLLVRDAMRYRELQKKLPEATKRVDKVKAATPGPSGAGRKAPKTKVTQAFERLEKTGSTDAFAAVLMATELAD
jgi:chromosome segregation ATPase